MLINDQWQIYNNFKSVESDLVTLLRYVDLDERNYSANSSEIRKLILLSCSLVEQSFRLLKIELQVPDSFFPKKATIPKKIFLITTHCKCPFNNLRPKIQEKSFNPWEPSSKDSISFDWWNTYIACKHANATNNLPFFKSAVESVAALFIITVFLTSKTGIQLGIFWHLNDYIKIATEEFPKPASIYNCTKSLRAQIWPEFKAFNHFTPC